MSGIDFHGGGFYSHAGTVYVPIRPGGTVKMRLVGDVVEINRFRFYRGDIGIPSETRHEATIRVPVSAVEALLAQLDEGKG